MIKNIWFACILLQLIVLLRFPNQKSKRDIFQDTRSRFESYSLRFLPCPLDFKSYYTVNFTVFRTHIVISFVSKQFEEEALWCLIEGNILDDKSSVDNEFDIAIDNIRALVADYDGFYIMTKDSQRGLYFSCPMVANKQKIMTKIESNAFKYLGNNITVEGLSKEYYLNVKMTEKEHGRDFKFYDAFRLTYFGDYIQMKLAVNDRYIYEIVNQMTTNQLSVENIIRIGINRARLRQIELYYSSGEVIRYAMRNENESSFMSQIHGVIQQPSNLGKTRFFQNSLIFLGRMNVENNIIWGIEQVESFREQYEKENFETFIKEQREDNFLNYHFISGFSGFTLRNFCSKFEGILTKSLKLIPAFRFRSDFEDSLINFLINPASSSSVMIRFNFIPVNQEEEWFSKLPTEEKKKASNIRKIIYQSKKIFRDQLKEILNEECFGEKIENELLVDRMWSFLANMMQSGAIMREISMSLNDISL